MSRIWCLVSFYSDGSGMPEVVFACDDEPTIDAVLRSIQAAEPMKRVVKVYPDAALFIWHVVNPSTT